MSTAALLAEWRSRAAASTRWKRAAVALVVCVFLVQWVHVAVRPRGDFHLHWEFGRRLAAGEFIYAGSLHAPYPPFWALAHAPLSVLPMHAAQILVFPMGAVALVVLLWAVRSLAREQLPATDHFWWTMLALGLASRFLVRDLLECGVNLALVAASWAAVALWSRGRDRLAGGVLGTAIALKCTPALFLAWFVWKRQWKVAAATAVTTAALTLAPLVWMGVDGYARAFGYWVQMASRGTGLDPSRGVLGEEPLQNVSLRAALGRVLMELPAGHQGRVEHPLSFELLDLSPAAAGWCAKAAAALLLVWVGWSMRGRATDRPGPEVAWECAAVSLLLLLLSPITWGQHCVGVLPVLCLAAWTAAAGRLPGWMRWTIAGYAVLTLGLNRAFLGQQLSWLLDSWGVTTWCLVALLVVAVRGRAEATRTLPASGSLVASGPLIAGTPALSELRAAAWRR